MRRRCREGGEEEKRWKEEAGGMWRGGVMVRYEREEVKGKGKVEKVN